MTALKPRLLNELEPRARTNSFTGLAELSGDPVVWLGQLAESREESLEFDSLLTDDERIRRDRFKCRPDQQRFAAGRAWLRVLLGAYLGLPPHQVILQYGDFGKPSVQRSVQTPAIYFNVAHSGDVVLLAFHGSCELGVDVEQFKVKQDWNDVARQLFPPERFARWAALEDNNRQSAFYQEWTQREAGLKAIGCGFAMEQPAGWDSQLTFFDVEVPIGYAGSVAVRPTPRGQFSVSRQESRNLVARLCLVTGCLEALPPVLARSGG